MSNTYTAISDDAIAVYFNPAGLAQLTSPELLYMPDYRYDTEEHSFFSFCLPLKSIKLPNIGALSYSENIYIPDPITGDNNKYISKMLSSGLKILPFTSYPQLYIGSSIKEINAIGISTGTLIKNTVVDAGFLFKIKYLSVGMAIVNYAPEVPDIPGILSPVMTKYRIGAGWNTDNLIISAEWEMNLENLTDFKNIPNWDMVITSCTRKSTGFEYCIYGQTEYVTERVQRPRKMSVSVPEKEKKKKEKKGKKEEIEKIKTEIVTDGVEYEIITKKITHPFRIFFRGGRFEETNGITQATLGLGIVYENFKFDFIVSPDGSDFVCFSFKF